MQTVNRELKRRQRRRQRKPQKKSKTSNFARAQVTLFVDYFAVDARLDGNFLHVSFMENLNTGQQFSFSVF